MARSSHTAALLCLAATVALLAWPQCAAAAVPAAAAVVQGDTAPAGSCRVRWPNTCLCKQGSCEGCAHCAGCDDNLCVAPPFARVAAPRTDTTEGLIDGTTAATQMVAAASVPQQAPSGAAVSAASVGTASAGGVTPQAVQAAAAAQPAASAAAEPQSVQHRSNAAATQQPAGGVPAAAAAAAGAEPALVNKRRGVARTMSDLSGLLVCDGELRNLTLPRPPYPTRFPFSTPYTLSGTGLACDRSGAGGKCGAQERVQCAPFSDNIGPITQNGDGTLFIKPSDPIIFALTNASQFLTYVKWTVYDVGTGGAKMVGVYGKSPSLGVALPPVQKVHEWQPSGEIMNSETGTYFCGACTNCEPGKGIAPMEVEAQAGAGFRSFELAQLYEDVRCGATCFDLDGSYWTGMDYVCIQPTCGDADLSTPGDQKYDGCSPDTEWVYNPASASSTDVSVQSCCLPMTCADTNPVTAPNTRFICPDGFVNNPKANHMSPANAEHCCTKFTPKCDNQDPTTPGVKFDCAAMGMYWKPSGANKTAKFPNDFLVCCDTKPDPSSTVDVYLTKTVTPDAVQNVGDVFTFTITVGLNSLTPAANVVVTDNVPPQLEVLEIVEVPKQNACKFTAATNVVRCTWPVLNLNDVKKVSVKTRVNEAGTWLQPACVTTTSNDTDPSNNCDNCTVSARGACCLRSFTTAACSNVLPSQCNAGTYSKNATCSQLTTCVPLPKERGACCLPTKASQRAALKAGAKAGAAEQPDAKHKGAATQKDDAKQASAARKGAAAQKDAAKQAGAAQKGASAHKGRALHASVEATKQMGTCMEGVTKEVCLAAHGTWFPSSTCRVSCPVPVPIPGACCDQRTGTCRDNVAQANCPPPAMWAADTQCRADGFCTGACCDMASGQCEQTLKVDCQTDSWAIYQQCSETCGPTKCIPKWNQCKPPPPGAKDPCCPGAACQFTYKGCKAGEYVCKPRDQCVPEDFPCGGYQGGCCCKGLVCKWDHTKRQGSCAKPDPCVPEGSPVTDVQTCCRGSRPVDGVCVACDFHSCHRKCKTYECYIERKKNCEVFFAAAASM